MTKDKHPFYQSLRMLPVQRHPSPSSTPALRAVSSVELRCLHCGSSQISDDSPGKSWQDGGEHYYLIRCHDCRGLFTYPTPTSALLNRVYGQEFDYAWYQQHRPAKLIDATHRLWQYFQHGFLTGKRLLDYGGGLGFFAEAARRLKYDAISFDPFAKGATQPSATLNPDDRFNVVTAHHVLEHAPDPHAMIATMRDLLTPDGTLIVAVPNGAAVGIQRLGERWVWSGMPFEHLNHFTAAGLRAILEQQGLEVIREQHFERWDANTLADVQLPELFAHLEAAQARSAWKWGYAQLTSMIRFFLAQGSYYLTSVPEHQRAELIIAARKKAGR